MIFLLKMNDYQSFFIVIIIIYIFIIKQNS